MTALFTVAYSADSSGIPDDEASFAIVADETKFQYVTLGPAEELDERSEFLNQHFADTTHSAEDWIRVAALNFNYIEFTTPAPAATLAAAIAAAETFLPDDVPSAEDSGIAADTNADDVLEDEEDVMKESDE